MALVEPIAHRIDVGGFELHVEDHGAGVPVLVLHGFAGSARRMAPIVAMLAEQHRVIAPDLIGHGRSDAPTAAAAYGWPAVTRQMKRVLDALDVGQVHLFGFSLGGRIALQLAARSPERVHAALVVGSRCAWPDAAERTARRLNDARLAARIDAEGCAALAGRDADEAAIAAAAPGAGAHGLAHVLRGLGAADQPEVGAALALGAVPLRLLAGSSDVGPLAAARALARDLPCARVVEIPGAGHRAHLERPEEVARLALEFFAGVDAEREPTMAPRAQHAGSGGGDRRW